MADRRVPFRRGGTFQVYIGRRKRVLLGIGRSIEDYLLPKLYAVREVEIFGAQEGGYENNHAALQPFRAP